MKIGYIPGVFDLFHKGHVNIIQNAILKCDHIIIGVNTDEFTSSYKRRPVQSQNERVTAIRNYFGSSILEVELVGDSHLHIINKHNITHIFHGTDWELESYKRHMRYYEDNLNVSIEMIPYTKDISTSLIISDFNNYKITDHVYQRKI